MTHALMRTGAETFTGPHPVHGPAWQLSVEQCSASPLLDMIARLGHASGPRVVYPYGESEATCSIPLRFDQLAMEAALDNQDFPFSLHGDLSDELRMARERFSVAHFLGVGGTYEDADEFVSRRVAESLHRICRERAVPASCVRTGVCASRSS